MFGAKCNFEFIKPFTTPETWVIDNMAIQKQTEVEFVHAVSAGGSVKFLPAV